MIKFFSAFILILSLVGCATSGSKSKSISNITNDDFVPVKPIRYSKSLDRLSGVESKYTAALNKESVARVKEYDGEFKEQNELDTLAQLCHEKEFKKAYDLVEEHSRKFIKNPIFWNHVGSCFLIEGQYRKAMLFLNRSLSIKPNYIPALNNLGVMYLKLKDRNRAMVSFKRAVRFGQFSKTPRFNLANLYLNYGMYKESLNVLKPFNRNTTDVDVLNMFASAYLMQGKVKQAITFFEKIDEDFLEKARYGLNYSVALYLDNKKNKASEVLGNLEVDKKSPWYEYYVQVKGKIGDRS